MDGVVHGRGHVLGGVASALGPEGGEVREDLVHVAREIVDAGEVSIDEVPVAHQRDAQVRPRPALADAPRDGPDAPLGPFDEAAHAARRVEHEGDLHAGTRARVRGDAGGRGGAGNAEDESDERHEASCPWYGCGPRRIPAPSHSQ